MLALERDGALAEYAGRILIEWGGAYRSWIQRPHLHNKPILEIRRQAVDPPFPGFQGFSWPIRELSSVPRAWRDVLRASRGVYLLVCRSSGRLYVGSAYGAEGFWSRFEEYYRTGHGSNKGMKTIDSHDFQTSILECAASSAAVDDIIRLEEVWKSKLLSRKFGLNLN